MTAVQTRIKAPVLGMVLFVASELLFFGSLFGAYYTVRAQAEEWPPAGTVELGLGLPLALTVVLLASSLTQHWASVAGRRGDANGTLKGMAATVLLGTLFLLGEAWEWRELSGHGLELSTNVFGTLFYTMTGFHGLHLLVGVGILLLAAAKVTRTRLGPRSHGLLEAATYYWHFVDAVWLGLVFTLYVVPRLG